MQLRDRPALESQFAARLATLNAKQRQELEYYLSLRDPPTYESVPEEAWQRWEKEHRDTLLALLLLIYLLTVDEHGGDSSAGQSGGILWAQQRATQTAASVINTSRDMLKSASDRWLADTEEWGQKIADARKAEATRLGVPDLHQTMPLSRELLDKLGLPTNPVPRQEVFDEAAKIFGPSRAEAEGVTEFTAAQSAGGEWGIETTVGTSEDDEWMTLYGSGEEDRKVCPVCHRLNKTKRAYWSRFFPDGSPAHPACRCSIRYALALHTPAMTRESLAAKLLRQNGQLVTRLVEVETQLREALESFPHHAGRPGHVGGSAPSSDGGAGHSDTPARSALLHPHTDEEIAHVQGIIQSGKDFFSKIVGDETNYANDVPREERQKFEKTLHACVDMMTAPMVERIKTTIGGATFYKSLEEMTATLFPDKFSQKTEGGRFLVGGAWATHSDERVGSLHLDGGGSSGDPRGFYAHELGHAIDFRYVHSNTPEWQDAYREEIDQPHHPLTKYATTSPSEGLAEYFRLLNMQFKDAKLSFPKCFAAFKKWGYV